MSLQLNGLTITVAAFVSNKNYLPYLGTDFHHLLCRPTRAWLQRSLKNCMVTLGSTRNGIVDVLKKSIDNASLLRMPEVFSVQAVDGKGMPLKK